MDDYREAAGDPFMAARRSSSLESIREIVRRSYPELIEAIKDEETLMGRPMNMGEIDALARGYHAEEYRLESTAWICAGLCHGESRSRTRKGAKHSLRSV